MSIYRVRIPAVFFVSLVFTLTLAVSAAQKTATWTGGDGNYSDPTNWDMDGGGNPGLEIPINNGSDTYIVSIPAGVKIAYDVVGANSVDEFYFAEGSFFTVNPALEFNVIGVADIGGQIDVDNAAMFSSPSAMSSFTGNKAQIHIQGTGITNLTLAAGTYDSRGINKGTILHADGSGSLLDLSTLGIIDDSSNHTFAQARTIEASNDATIDLSRLHTLRGGIGDDRTQMVESASGTIDLPSLTTVTGNVEFVSDKSIFGLPNLATAEAMSFTLNSGFTLNLPSLVQQTGGRYDLPSSSTCNVGALTTMRGTTVTIEGGASFNAPNLSNIDNSFINISGGLAFALPNVTTYDGKGFNGSDTFFSAEGAGTILDLQNITSLDSSSNHTFSQTRTISAADGGLVDLSNLQTLHGATGDDMVEIKTSSGGVVDVSNLATTTGRVRFHTDTDLSLANLQNADSLFFTMQPGSLLEMNALVSQTGGSYDLPAGATVNLNALATMQNTALTIDDASSAFNAPNLGNIDNSFVSISDGSTFGFPNVTTYNGKGFNSSDTFFSAEGAGTILDLQNITSLDSSSNHTFSQTRTISAADNGLVDLSNLQTLHGGTGDDFVEIKTRSGGVVDISNLTTTTGRVHFNTDTDLQLTTLQNADSLFFTMQPGSLLEMNALVSQAGGSYDLPTGATFNLGTLTTMQNTTLTISDASSTFNAPNLSDIDNSFVNISGGTSLALSNVTTYDGKGFSNGTFFLAEGAGTTLDLQNITLLDSGSNHTFAQTRTIRAADSAAINLSGVDTVLGGIGDDKLRIVAESGGQIDLSSLQSVTTGNVIFDVEAEGTLQLGDFTVTGNSTFNINDVTSTVNVTGSLLLDPESKMNIATAGGISVAENFSFATQDETALNFVSGILEMDGIGSFAAPQFLEVGSEDLGLPLALTDPTTIPGVSNNFAIGQLIVGQDSQATVLSLIDAIDNGNRNSLEALYLPGLGDDGLQILGGSVLDLNYINTYAFLDGQWMHLNSLFTGGITQIDISSLTTSPVADGIVMIPEPISLSLVSIGGLVLLRRRRRETNRTC